jgi:hypothetical protein
MENQNMVEFISYKFEGVHVSQNIENATAFDYSIFEPKKNTILFRLKSWNTCSQAIVCVNVEKSLIYFLQDYNVEDSNWETRGIKLNFPVIVNGRSL